MWVDTARVQLLGAARAVIGQAALTFADDKRFQLLAYLACKADWVSREHLAGVFWPETSSSAARKNLRHLIQRVRGLDWLTGFDAEVEHLRWRVASDVAAFRAASARGAWDEALAWYHGPLLDDFQADESAEFASWLEAERSALQERWREAALGQARALVARGAHADALHILERLLAHDPLDEDALDQFMRLAAELDQRGTALRSYEVFARRLRQELGLLPPTRLERLAEAIRASQSAPAQVATRERPAPPRPALRPLPLAMTPFVGRELVLAELTSLLAQREHRLITLCGAAGVGKTRVALQFAHEQPPDRAVGFVNLVPLGQPEAIPGALAEATGLVLKGQAAPLAQVAAHIGRRPLLLVVDNFEHLQAGSGQLAALLQACPELVLLVTSREPLGLMGEWLLPVAGFAVPERTEIAPGEIHSLEAVQLFEQQARRVRPDFRLEADSLAQVLMICGLVDGLPLGIELAAVWTRALPLPEIAREIGQNLDFLASRSPDLPERHRSLRAVFEHTWGLLTPEEQRALRWLSVARGGFDREAVRVAARVPLPVLGSLVDKSLLSLNALGRYKRHRLLHQFSEEKLAQDPPEAAEARASHAQHYLRLLRTGLEGIRGPQVRQALETLETELENIRVAWRWAVEQRRGALLKEGAEALMRFFDARGRFQEAIDLLGEGIAALSHGDPADPAALGTLLVHQSKFFARRGQPERAERRAREGLRLLEGLEEREAVIWGLGHLAAALEDQGQVEASLPPRQRAVAEARALANERLTAVTLGWLALSEERLGRAAQARARYREAIHLFQQQGNLIGTLFSLSNLAGNLVDEGEFAAAIPLLQEAVGLARSAGELGQLSGLLTSLGECAFRLGDLDGALTSTRQALESASEQFHADQVHLLITLGEISHAQGQPAQARASLAEALGLTWEAHDWPLTMAVLLAWAEQLAHDPALAARLHRTVFQHPATRHAERERARRWLATQGALPAQADDTADLGELIQQLRFGDDREP